MPSPSRSTKNSVISMKKKSTVRCATSPPNLRPEFQRGAAVDATQDVGGRHGRRQIVLPPMRDRSGAEGQVRHPLRHGNARGRGLLDHHHDLMRLARPLHREDDERQSEKQRHGDGEQGRQDDIVPVSEAAALGASIERPDRDGQDAGPDHRRQEVLDRPDAEPQQDPDEDKAGTALHALREAGRGFGNGLDGVHPGVAPPGLSDAAPRMGRLAETGCRRGSGCRPEQNPFAFARQLASAACCIVTSRSSGSQGLGMNITSGGRIRGFSP